MSLATVTLFAQYVGRHKKILTVRHTAPQVPVPVIRHWARPRRGCPVYRYMHMHEYSVLRSTMVLSVYCTVRIHWAEPRAEQHHVCACVSTRMHIGSCSE